MTMLWLSLKRCCVAVLQEAQAVPAASMVASGDTDNATVVMMCGAAVRDTCCPVVPHAVPHMLPGLRHACSAPCMQQV